MSTPSTKKRRNTAGHPDLSFGNSMPKDGTVIAEPSGGLSRVLSDGSTITVGLTAVEKTKVIVVSKHTLAGELDKNYGVWMTPVPNTFALVDLLIQRDNKPLLLSAQGDLYTACVTRFNADQGTVDFSFGDKGTTELGDSFNPHLLIAGAIAVQATGHIVVVFNDAETSFIYQLNSNGQESNFGNQGPIEAPNTRLDRVLITDRGFVLAGSSARKAHILGLLHHGELDHSFGSQGVVVLPFTTNEDRKVDALAKDQNGQIVVIGGSFGIPRGMNFVAVLLAGGQLDPQFNEGKPLESEASYGNYTSGLVQPDGKIVVLARYGNGSIVRLLRFNPNSQPDATFGIGGIADAWRDPQGRPEHTEINRVEWVTVNSTLQSSGILHTSRASFIGRLLSQ